MAVGSRRRRRSDLQAVDPAIGVSLHQADWAVPARRGVSEDQQGWPKRFPPVQEHFDERAAAIPYEPRTTAGMRGSIELRTAEVQCPKLQSGLFLEWVGR